MADGVFFTEVLGLDNEVGHSKRASFKGLVLSVSTPTEMSELSCYRASTVEADRFVSPSSCGRRF